MDPMKTICRDATFTYNVQCKFDRRLNVSVDEGTNVTVKKSFTFEKKSKTNITAEIQFYKSTLYNTIAATPLEVISFILLLEVLFDRA